jgi:hypothetical protein
MQAGSRPDPRQKVNEAPTSARIKRQLWTSVMNMEAARTPKRRKRLTETVHRES